MIAQVMALTPQQIAALPPEQRAQVELLNRLRVPKSDCCEEQAGHAGRGLTMPGPRLARHECERIRPVPSVGGHSSANLDGIPERSSRSMHGKALYVHRSYIGHMKSDVDDGRL